MHAPRVCAASRLASGDSNGDVAVWDVQTQSVATTLDDALLGAGGSNTPKVMGMPCMAFGVAAALGVRHALIHII